MLLHHDKWVEVYAEKNIDARVAVMPHMTTPEGERLAEQYLELTLPKRYRALYWPGSRRAADMVRTIKPQDIARQKWELEMMTTLDAIAARNKEGGTVWVA